MFKRVFVLSFSCVLMLAGSVFAEKSMWDKFKDFFSPAESFDCDGPICDEIHSLESKINKAEGKYSRERRPVNKERYKKEIAALNASRDSLIVVYKNQASAVKSSSSSIVAAVSTASVSSAVSSAAVSSSSAVPATQPALSETKVLSAAEVAALVCKPDTVFVHDTVKVRDTVYVIVTNKPAAPAAEPAVPAAP